jgi:hypothetical protein
MGGLHALPELLVIDSRPFIDATVGRIKESTPFPRMGQEQAPQLVIILNSEQHRHRFAIARV